MSTSPAVPPAVRPRRVVTDRRGGRSRPPYDSFNLGDHVGDDPADLAANRGRVARELGVPEERLVAPQGAPAMSATGNAAPPAATGRPAPATNGGGITVPPLPPIPGPVSGRRPLSNEAFEEELDIPEFLKQ